MAELPELPETTQFPLMTSSSSGPQIVDVVSSTAETVHGFLIRYEIYVYISDDGDTDAKVYRIMCPIVRKTLACDVIDYHSQIKYVKRAAKKKFAYSTEREAIHSLGKRTQWRMYYAERSMDQAKLAKQAFEKLFSYNGDINGA
jgi:hypothetical protein